MVRQAARLLPASCEGPSVPAGPALGGVLGPQLWGMPPADSPPWQPVGNHLHEESTLFSSRLPPGAARTRRLTDTLPLTQPGHPTPRLRGHGRPACLGATLFPTAPRPHPPRILAGHGHCSLAPGRPACDTALWHPLSLLCSRAVSLQVWPLTAGVRLSPSPHEDAGAGASASFSNHRP